MSFVEAYPADREADVVLRDGSTVRVRPVRPKDRAAIHSFLTALSEGSRRLRFFTGLADLERLADRAADVDYRDRLGLVAVVRGTIVAHAVYLVTGTGRAEAAFAVADEYQGRGLGTIMLGQLAEAASDHGIVLFEAEVLPENHRMIEVFRQSGFPIETLSEPGAITIRFPTSLTPRAREHFERRERIAAMAAMTTFLSPRSIAVVGASRTRGTIGGEVFHNLLASGFTGPVYPVNPKADVVQSVAAYPDVTSIPGPVDLAVIVVPAPVVTQVARECAAAGVRALVVISSGFGEIGGVGQDRQRELLEVCRETGMRLIGPNCMGIMNTAPDVQMNATFAPTFPPRGRIGFLSQSGALGLAVIDLAASRGLGLSSFVSVGNKADISGNDLLHHWEADEDTDLILLYLESFGNPRSFSRIAQRVGRAKPIVAVKSGRSAAGARATSSHTGALIAASDVTVDALFAQAGVVRTDTLEELFDVAALLATQPVPAGPRVAIVTNAGGLGILCADACEAAGLDVVTLSDEGQRHLRAFLPAEAAVANPVDMIAAASAEDYGRTIEVVAGEADAVIVIFIPPLVTRAEDVAREVRRAAEVMDDAVPLLSVFMSARGVPSALREGSRRIPSFGFPEDAARALAHAARYGAWRARPPGRARRFPDARRDEASGLVAAALAEGVSWLAPEVTLRLLDCYGIPVAPWRTANGPSDARTAAEELGGRVALKAITPSLVHKIDAGAVRLGLTPETIGRAAEEMAEAVARAGHDVDRFLVQGMVEGSVEMLVGVVHDALFGPVVACGAGGTTAELTKDIAVRITPLSEGDASEMLRSLRTFPLLEGYRGSPPVDRAALEDLLLRVGALVEDLPGVAEMDLNPVIASDVGVVAVDARVRVETPHPPLPVSARRR